MDLFSLKEQNKRLKKQNKSLRKLCKVKDSYFLELISDGLRHGSKLAARHMADWRKYRNGK